MSYENIHKFFPDVKFSKNVDLDLPAFIGERRILVMVKSSAEEIYKRFEESLNTYLQKIPDSYAKDAVMIALNKGIIRLGRDVTGAKNGIVGTVFIKKDGSLSGIALDVSELDIDPTTGETDNIDDCFYSIYFSFIRAAVLIFKDQIRVNKEIHNLSIHYLYILLLKLLGGNVYFDEKEKKILEIITRYFYFRFQVFEHHEKAKELAFSDVSNELVNELSPIVNNLDKYKYMKDLFKTLIDFKLVREDPHNIYLIILRKLKNLGFYSITTSIDYLIAYIITSQYPFSLISISTINSTLQSRLEKIIFSYVRKTKFDPLAIP